MMAFRLTVLFVLIAAIMLRAKAFTAKRNDAILRFDEKVTGSESLTVPLPDEFVESTLLFKVKSKDIQSGAFGCVQTSKINVYGIPWKIKACKFVKKEIDSQNPSETSTANFLHVYLIAVFNGTATERYSVKAKADKFTLFHNEESDKNIEKTLNERVFNGEAPEHLIEFGKWENFIANHLIDDEATFEVNLKLMPNPLSPLEQLSTIFFVKIQNVHNENGTHASYVIVRGVRWHVFVTKSIYNNEGNLAIYLYGNVDDLIINYGYDVVVTFKLCSTKKDTSRSLTLKHKFQWTEPGRGYSNFIKWTDLMDQDKGFVHGKAALFEITLNVDEPKKLQ